MQMKRRMRISEEAEAGTIGPGEEVLICSAWKVVVHMGEEGETPTCDYHYGEYWKLRLSITFGEVSLIWGNMTNPNSGQQVWAPKTAALVVLRSQSTGHQGLHSEEGAPFLGPAVKTHGVQGIATGKDELRFPEPDPLSNITYECLYGYTAIRRVSLRASAIEPSQEFPRYMPNV
ncbi:uncharacterized protein BCR38DRAFT_412858 [Pseudomassariella vexata]|uniref:Uncharacterized protein n=1 Tax=Pseudomassariella vexata TaxID=1141098 RepID=A0A1Y2DK53_9PEZI|nr:uncharacterized protein BCR38DRAFT_412858 [Pseudomassariella vexata]ORY59145.1 hypothetical protein BCR38DRAFT_412858 [Pseudomassariella vexata]